MQHWEWVGVNRMAGKGERPTVCTRREQGAGGDRELGGERMESRLSFGLGRRGLGRGGGLPCSREAPLPHSPSGDNPEEDKPRRQTSGGLLRDARQRASFCQIGYFPASWTRAL